MPDINVSNETFERFKNLATPFEDTPESLLIKLMNKFEGNQFQEHHSENPKNKEIISLSPNDLSKLRHTKLLAAKFGDIKPNKCYWNSIAQLALTKVLDKTGGDVYELQRVSGANVTPGRKIDEGYTFIASHNFSCQGVNAINAAGIVIRCAEFLECDVYLEFAWHIKDEAHKPGKRASIQYPIT